MYTAAPIRRITDIEMTKRGQVMGAGAGEGGDQGCREVVEFSITQ
jgi:hypothetical protein